MEEKIMCKTCGCQQENPFNGRSWGFTSRAYMARANCRIIAQYAEELLNILGSNDTLADWMEYYITIARTYISDAYHAWEGMADRYREMATNPAITESPYTSASYMVRQNLTSLAEYANKLHDLILPGERLPDWMENKIAVARRYMGDVKHHIEYLQEYGLDDHLYNYDERFCNEEDYDEICEI
jgi:hypothetical protein